MERMKDVRKLEDVAWGAYVSGALAALDDALLECETEPEMTAALRERFDRYWAEVVGKAYLLATDAKGSPDA